jgi:peptidoglycan-associated lipoprotein
LPSRLAELGSLLLALSLTACSLPPLPTDPMPLPCAEEIGGQIAFVYKSQGRFLFGRAACDQYFEDVRAALESGSAPTGPLSPLEAMQLAPPPIPRPPSLEPSTPPTAVDRPALTGFRPSAPLRAIHFAFDSAEIRAEDVRTLHDYAEWLQANAGYTVLIEGHCDERGTPAYNLALGDRRAAATKEYLARRGVDPNRILTVSYGEFRPLCTQPTEACWALNRRAEFLLGER